MFIMSGPFIGVPWSVPTDNEPYSLRLLYDSNGFIIGMQTAVELLSILNEVIFE
jgi:hypothetical protein